ncbi:MAG: LOG family protein, partial [Planctomycetaceae bacterium]
MPAVCVFCGSKSGDRPEYAEAAEELGRSLARSGYPLIYGGGSTGIMGLLAESVLQGGGRVTGVITEHLARPELMHSGVADMR